ncbi:MAG TPA: Maf family protein [Ktedonobacterales bacterium]|nr:Maf family protein [Ktedonobacterales bacterium]
MHTEDLPLFLASSSPRRHQLLAAAGITFEPFVVAVDEDALTETYSGPLEHLGEFLACQKALAARDALAGQSKRGMVLAADTTVLLDGRSLAKPRDHDEAVRMLEALRGREHIVATGVALAPPAPAALTSATAATRVLMREYSDAEIEAYVATGDSLDKAGGYSIQYPAFSPVARIAGCHLGVIGLPVCIVARLLGRGSLPPLAPVMLPGGALCVWSAQCTSPLPTEDALTPGDRSREAAL